MSEETRTFEDLIRRALSNPAGEELLDELKKMYVNRVSFQDMNGFKFEDVAFREGQRFIVLMLDEVIKGDN